MTDTHPSPEKVHARLAHLRNARGFKSKTIELHPNNLHAVYEWEVFWDHAGDQLELEARSRGAPSITQVTPVVGGAH